jgi:hypothetical protein
MHVPRGSIRNRLFWFSALGIAVLSIILAQRVASSHLLSFAAAQSASIVGPAETANSAPEIVRPPTATASSTPEQIPSNEPVCRGLHLLDIEPTAEGHQSGAWLAHDTLGLQLVAVAGTLGKFTLTRVAEKGGAAQAWLSSPDGPCSVMVQQPSQVANLVARKTTVTFVPTSRMNSEATAPTVPAKSIMADTDRARMRLVNQVLKQSLSR